MSDPSAAAVKGIHQILAQHQGDSYVNGWDELWNKCDNLPWDRGFPNPALEDTLTERRSTVGEPLAQDAQGKTYRRKALVPGCGRGVDVLLLASFGYDAYGLECSAGAVEACKQEQAKNGDKYPARDKEVGLGKIAFVHGDFFKNDWLEKLGLSLNSFDLVYDYTVCICGSVLYCLLGMLVVLTPGCSSSVRWIRHCVQNGLYGIPSCLPLHRLAI